MSTSGFQTDKVCVRCHKEFNGYPAISRRDNLTKICPECGNEEAFIDYYGLKAMTKWQQERELTFRKKLGLIK